MGSVFAWAATAIALAGTVLNARMVRSCFLLWLAANAMWFAWDVGSGLHSRAVLDAVQFALAAYGYREWGRKGEKCSRK